MPASTRLQHTGVSVDPSSTGAAARGRMHCIPQTWYVSPITLLCCCSVTPSLPLVAPHRPMRCVRDDGREKEATVATACWGPDDGKGHVVRAVVLSFRLLPTSINPHVPRRDFTSGTRRPTVMTCASDDERQKNTNDSRV